MSQTNTDSLARANAAVEEGVRLAMAADGIQADNLQRATRCNGCVTITRSRPGSGIARRRADSEQDNLLGADWRCGSYRLSGLGFRKQVVEAKPVWPASGQNQQF